MAGSLLRVAQAGVNAAWAAGHVARRAIGPRNELRAMDVEDLAKAMRDALGGPSWTGLSITPDMAMRSPTVWTAVRVLGESMAQLPFNLIREDGGRRVAVEDHPVQRLLGPHGKPNRWQSAAEFREQMVRWCAIRGNAVAIKVTVRGELRELLPVHPKTVEIRQEDDWSVRYRVTTERGQAREFRSDEVFHLRGPGDSGFAGDDVVVRMREAIGLALGQDMFAARMFANGAKLSGVLQTDEKLSDPAYERLKQNFQDLWSGVENAHGTPILEEGLKFEKASQTNEDAQLLDSRKLQRSIVAAILRVPPHMTGDLEKATFSNIYDLARQFVDYALTPWAVRYEGAVETQLLSDEERGRIVAKLKLQALLRGNVKERTEMYARGIQSGWMNRNEPRELEDMDRGPDHLDEFLEPENMRQAGEEPAEDTTEDDGADSREGDMNDGGENAET